MKQGAQPVSAMVAEASMRDLLHLPAAAYWVLMMEPVSHSHSHRAWRYRMKKEMKEQAISSLMRQAQARWQAAPHCSRF